MGSYKPGESTVCSVILVLVSIITQNVVANSKPRPAYRVEFLINFSTRRVAMQTLYKFALGILACSTRDWEAATGEYFDVIWPDTGSYRESSPFLISLSIFPVDGTFALRLKVTIYHENHEI